MLETILAYVVVCGGIIVSPIIVIVWLLIVGRLVRYAMYLIHIRSSKELTAYPHISIPPCVSELIDRIDARVRIRISNQKDFFAQAVYYDNHQPYIILGAELVTPTNDNALLLEPDEIAAIVAHELGHICSKIPSAWAFSVIVAGILGIFILAAFTKFSLGIVALVIFLYLWLLSVSRNEERQADSFTILDARISVTTFSQSLVKIQVYIDEKKIYPSKWRHLFNSLIIFITNTHPSTDQRVSRLVALYPHR